jgi:hypothetical protein
VQHYSDMLLQTWPDAHDGLNCHEAFSAFMGPEWGFFVDPVQSDKSFCWLESTMFVAIGMALLRGAKEIVVYGAPMTGSGYYRPGMENSRTDHTDRRWIAERMRFALLQVALSERGVQLRRAACV